MNRRYCKGVSKEKAVEFTEWEKMACALVCDEVGHQIGLQCKAWISLQISDFRNKCIWVFLALHIFCGFGILS